MDYAMLIIIGVRISVTILVVHFIEQSFSGFELIDKKEMSDVIPFMATPAMILAGCNFKFNMILTVPMAFASTVYVIQRTLSVQDDNVSCFKNAEFYADSTSEKQVLQLLTMLVGLYLYRKATLERFIEQEKSKKQ